MKKLFYLIILAATIFSCKKDEDPVFTGKWNVVSITTTEFYNGTPTSTDTEPGGGRTLDFQSGGTLVTTYNGTTESTPYIMKPDNKVEFQGETYEIRNLEENSVTLYVRNNWGAPTYYDDVLVQMSR
jgi:hypothetical protein